MTTLPLSVQLPASPPIAGHPPRRTTPAGKPHLRLRPTSLRLSANRSLSSLRAIEKSKESSESSEIGSVPTEDELTQVGSEIQKAMEEKKASTAEESGLFAGVSSETKEIEWPPFGKVLGITWVVLGVIAGSSVVLLTLNVVLAELSDKVFTGRGVQDFFG